MFLLEKLSLEFARNVKGMGRLKISKANNRLDISNQRFGKLLVLKYEDSNPRDGHARWRCGCDCGTEVVVQVNNLLRRGTHQCQKCAVSGHIKPDTAARALHSRYRRDATKRGFVFELSWDEFLAIIAKPCFYCGILPRQMGDRRKTHLEHLSTMAWTV